MAGDEDRLNKIYDRTAGRCHIRRKRLSFQNYGRPGRRAAWGYAHQPAAAGAKHPIAAAAAGNLPVHMGMGWRDSAHLREALSGEYPSRALDQLHVKLHPPPDNEAP